MRLKGRKYFCKCGCGGRIKIKKHHKWYGVPDFIKGHQLKGQNHPNYGKHLSDKTKEKISKGNSGKKRSAEAKQKDRLRMLGNKYAKGYKHTPETIRKMKLLRHTPAWKKMMREKMLGRIVSPKTRRLQSKVKIGKDNPNRRKYFYKKKYFCKCGCGGKIKILKHHKYHCIGVPDFIHGHGSKRRVWKREVRKRMLGNKYGLGNQNCLGRILSDKTKEKLKKARLHQIIPFKDTSIEVKLQKALSEHGIQFRKHELIIGQPDIFIEPNICIFADGDYWHNMERGKKQDKKVNRKLTEAGYVVLRFWEHQINKDLAGCLNKIILER